MCSSQQTHERITADTARAGVTDGVHSSRLELDADLLEAVFAEAEERIRRESGVVSNDVGE